MWMGVTKGLAGIKFSGSPRSHGLIVHKYKNKKIKITIPKISFHEK
jgi:hypothetical protein